MNNIDENKLEHSNEALNITHQFYDKKFMLYVEGDDDVVFWDENFRRYLRKNNIDVSLTPDDLLRKHYDVFQKLTDIEKDFKR